MFRRRWKINSEKWEMDEYCERQNKGKSGSLCCFQMSQTTQAHLAYLRGGELSIMDCEVCLKDFPYA